jgi:hypothetical protein
VIYVKRIPRAQHHFQNYIFVFHYTCRPMYRVVQSTRWKQTICHKPLANVFTWVIESGRLYGVSRDDRMWPLCDSNDIGDEYHYIMSCKAILKERKQFLPHFCSSNSITLLLDHLFKKSLKIPKGGNQIPYIKEEQTTQWPKDTKGR